MTEEQLKEYEYLDDIFQERCYEVCQILKRLNSAYGHLENFQICMGEVCGEGNEYWGYGGHEHYTETFSSKWLYTPNSEIEEYVNTMISKK